MCIRDSNHGDRSKWQVCFCRVESENQEIGGSYHERYRLQQDIVVDVYKRQGFEKGQVTELGAVNVMTGIYTGRSPKDKFFVKNEASEDSVSVSYTHLDVYKRQVTR